MVVILCINTSHTFHIQVVMGTTVTVAALTVGQFAAHFAFPPAPKDVKRKYLKLTGCISVCLQSKFRF